MKVWCLLVLSVISLSGEDFTLKVEESQYEILVSLPKNHDPAQNWPAVFYYHGTNGRPDTSLIRAHSGEEDWIVVGMSYAKAGTFQLTSAGMDAEVRILQEVQSALQKRINLDPGRVYVAGFSKGGWVSGLLLQRERSLAGGAILGAGHMHQLEASTPPFAKGLPVFVGIGRYDGNYPFGLNALVFFRKLGADPMLETWPGIGHQFPKAGSTGLKEWLALQSGKKADEKALEMELQEILALEDDYQKWESLIEFSERPFVQATAGWKEKVDARRLEVEKKPSIVREVRILKESRRLLAKELNKKTLPDFEAVAAGYARIAENAKGSPQGIVAAKDYERFAEILDLALAQFGKQQRERKEVEVKPETEKRRIPMNPLVR